VSGRSRAGLTGRPNREGIGGGGGGGFLGRRFFPGSGRLGLSFAPRPAARWYPKAVSRASSEKKPGKASENARKGSRLPRRQGEP